MAPEPTASPADGPGGGGGGGAAARKARPARPDGDRHKEQLAAIDAEISKLRQQQDEVRDRLGRADTRKGPLAERRGQLVARLQAIRTEQAGLRRARGKVFDRQEALAASVAKRTAELKAQQAKQTCKSAGEIDEAIAQKTRQIKSGALTLVEERRLENEVAGLRRARKQAEQAEALQRAIDAELAELAEIDAQLADTNAQALSEEHAALERELDGLRASQEEGHQQRGELFAERARVAKALDRAWERKRALQNEYRQENNAFFQWQQDERKRRAAEDKQRRAQELREKRLALAQEQREEAEAPAFSSEIGSCDALIAYLSGLSLPSSNGARSEDASRPSSSASEAGRRRQGGRRARADALKLPLAVAEGFLELQVELPTTAASVPAAIERLAARKQHFVERQPQATAENKKKVEEKIARLMAELDADEKIIE
ncbi:multicopy suppressor of BFA (Brefeldin A) [Coemansia javaensis]|uniref:Multicopy suppressor of BFA (Brefeldin A) n=1 Tax=Coemansia javaensis TaxID=2761396 RepID=A0A9W8HGB7_9FUNG|nr:multicopy suppressor of BFA (Brefeldin A) [Coemansia javaensis]